MHVTCATSLLITQCFDTVYRFCTEPPTDFTETEFISSRCRKPLFPSDSTLVTDFTQNKYIKQYTTTFVVRYLTSNFLQCADQKSLGVWS